MVRRRVVAAAALVGLVLLLTGLWQVTGGRPATSVTLTLPATTAVGDVPAVPVVVSGLDLPDDDAPPELRGLQVEATAGPAVPVFIGIGRRPDVDAYLGGVARSKMVGDDVSAGLRTTTVAGESALPDPASVDVWAAQVHGPDAVMLTWPRTPGQWRLVAGTDGTGPAPRLRLTYRLTPGPGPAPLLLAAGSVLLLAGGAALRAARSRDPAPGAGG